MKPKLLYIAGLGHNGSTILDLLLGESKGYLSTSQLNDLPALYSPDPAKRPSDTFWLQILKTMSDADIDHLRFDNLYTIFSNFRDVRQTSWL